MICYLGNEHKNCAGAHVDMRLQRKTIFLTTFHLLAGHGILWELLVSNRLDISVKESG